MLRIHLRVKFRALGITYKIIKEDWVFPLPIRANIPEIVDYHRYGIDLTVEVRS